MNLFQNQKLLKKLSKQLFIVMGLSILTSLNTQAQNFAYYPFNSVFAISTNNINTVYVDFRTFTNSYFTSVTMDIAPQVNVAHTPRADYYVGAGAKVNLYNVFNGYQPVEGYFVNGGVRVRPFDKFRRVNVIFEISPYAVKEFDAGLFRTMLGIGYNFDQRK